jgi:hypothetical protein
MISSDINDLTIGQISRLVGANDIDANEFGARVIRFLGLAAKAVTTQAENRDMLNLGGVLANNLNNEAFRAHLSEVLVGGPYTVTQMLADFERRCWPTSEN